MATRADVRRIALALPATEEARDRFAFSVRRKGKLKGFAWVWMKRIDPKKPRVPEASVIALRVPSVADRDRMIADRPDRFFTEPHYNGFPAVLLRLAAVSAAQLEPLVEQAWKCQAPPDLWKEPRPSKPARQKKATSRARVRKKS